MLHRTFALVVAFVLVLAACGGSDESSSQVASLSDDTAASREPSGNAEAAEGADEAALLAFTECLRGEGVDIDDPTVDADGNVQLARPQFENEGEEQGPGGAFREAFRTCEELIDGVTLGFRGDQDITELQDTLLEYAGCMRDNGYDMPDPDLSSFGPGSDDEDADNGGGPGGGPGGIFGAIDPDDPAFVVAQESCGDILAGFGPGGGPGGGPGRGGNDG